MVSEKQLFFKLTLGLKYDNSLSKIAKKKIFPSLPVAVFSPPALTETNIFLFLCLTVFLAKLEQIIVILKRFPRIKYYNNIHNNHISLVIKRQLKQKYIIKVSKKLVP